MRVRIISKILINIIHAHNIQNDLGLETIEWTGNSTESRCKREWNALQSTEYYILQDNTECLN